MTDAPQLLIEWSSPWREFFAAIGPALRPSPPRFRLETRAGLFPFRGMLLTMLLEIAALAGAMVLPRNGVQPASLQVAPPAHEVIYFSTDELPRTEDLAGAAGGKAGRSGGASLRHTQAIRVARDELVRERVADAPRLDLPKSDSQIRNLLAYRADAGPAPAEELALKRQAPQMAMAVVPPPPEISASAVQHPELPQTRLANPAVVPPPVEISQYVLARRSLLATTTVVPPPVSAPVQITSRPARLTLPAEAVVAPPAEISHAIQSRHASGEFIPRVVPPPVELAPVRTSSPVAALSGKPTVAPPPIEMQNAQPRAVRGLGNAAVAPPPPAIASMRRDRTLTAANVSVLPPPDLTAASNHNSAGAAGIGNGPPSSGAGVVVSPQPGSRPGLPTNSEKATLAMSPSGSATSGAAGSGNGSGIGRGGSPGNAPAGVGSGSTAVGAGRGASAYDRPGNSSTPGPGGAGNLSTGTSRVPGVSVSGGSNVVTLPSFGVAPDPATAGHSNAKGVRNGITVVASPRSGGALNLYGVLQGDRVYTIYIKTALGTAVMQFADPTSAANTYDTDLTAPQAIRVAVPSGLERSRLVIACVLGRNGLLRHWRVLQSDSSDFSAQILSALPDWKFSPASRGDEAVEVNAILGFGVDTK